jgi:hypothetical protein
MEAVLWYVLASNVTRLIQSGLSDHDGWQPFCVWAQTVICNAVLWFRKLLSRTASMEYDLWFRYLNSTYALDNNFKTSKWTSDTQFLSVTRTCCQIALCLRDVQFWLWKISEFLFAIIRTVPGSSVSIVSWLLTGRQGNEVRYPAEAKGFFL